MPELARERDLLDGRDRAVDGDQQPRAARGQPPDGRRREAVAVADAVGQVAVDVGAERAQRAHEDRRRADAVDVVVAVDGDPRAGARRARRIIATASLDARERARRRAPRRPPGRRARASGSPSPRRTSTCASVRAHAELARAARATSLARAVGRSRSASARQRRRDGTASGADGSARRRYRLLSDGCVPASSRSRRMPSTYTSADADQRARDRLSRSPTSVGAFAGDRAAPETLTP